jgi:hypothetical protein
MTTNKIPQQGSNSSFDAFEYLRCGYEIDDIQSTSDRFKCAYCQLIIKEPIQLIECGDRCCKGCFESRAAPLTIDDVMICPAAECETKFHKNQVRTIFLLI